MSGVDFDDGYPGGNKRHSIAPTLRVSVQMRTGSAPPPENIAQWPPSLVPSMADIAAVPSNGLYVVSTFSGCGGSCLGFRMAGYKPVFASEFIPAAQEVYRANNPDTHIDTRDIRQLTAEDILTATGIAPGEVDVLEGSPPCASFSTAGKREGGWTKVKAYSDTKQRTDDLFFEFARIVQGLQPRVFVAENVKGLTIGVAKGYLKEILTALRGCGYKVKCAVLDAQYFGVPQHRERLIFIGVREDIGIEPTFLKPQTKPVPLKALLPHIVAVGKNSGFGSDEMAPADRPSTTVGASPNTGNGRCPASDYVAIDRYAIGAEWDKLKPGEQSEKYFNLIRVDPNGPAPCITQTAGQVLSAAGATHWAEKRKFTIAELKRICGFPDDFILLGTYAQQYERLGRAVPPPMMAAIAAHIRDTILLPPEGGE